MIVNLAFTRYGGTQPIDLTSVTLAFIASQYLDGKSPPQVNIQWDAHTDPANGKSQLIVPSSLTGNLTPGDYYFNITAVDQSGNVSTYAAGTWPITPVPGTVGGAPPPTGSDEIVYITDAPSDGQLYVRFDATWTVMPTVAGPTGPPGPSAVSADANNTAVLGSDHLIFVPMPAGVTNGAPAGPGQIGEVISASITANQPMTSGVTMNIGSIYLTAGDWDVDGQAVINPSNAPTVAAAGVNTVSAILPAGNTAAGSGQVIRAAFGSGIVQLATGRAVVNVSAVTLVYLVASCTFASGACTATGYISARRRR